VHWSDQIYIVSSLLFKGGKYLCKTGLRYFFSRSASGYFTILTENASQRASAEKYRSRASGSAYWRFFPKMQCGTGDLHFLGGGTRSRLYFSVYAAVSWAKSALLHFLTAFF
jgi:hypothetical protein